MKLHEQGNGFPCEGHGSRRVRGDDNNNIFSVHFLPLAVTDQMMKLEEKFLWSSRRSKAGQALGVK